VYIRLGVAPPATLLAPLEGGINLLMQAIDEALNDVALPRFGSLLRNIAGGFAPAPSLVFNELFM
jgi:hypothetical protein